MLPSSSPQNTPNLGSEARPPKVKITHLPFSVIASILERVPNAPTQLATVCSTFYKAVQELTASHEIDLIPQLPVDAEPASAPLLHLHLSSPLHRWITAGQLRAVRLPSNLCASHALGLLSEISSTCPNLRHLAFTDGRTPGGWVSGAVLGTLPRLTSLEVNKPCAAVLRRLHEASSLNRLSLTGLGHVNLPLLAEKICGLPDTLRTLHLSIGPIDPDGESSALMIEDPGALSDFLQLFNSPTLYLATHLTELSLCVYGKSNAIRNFIRDFKNQWESVTVKLANPPHRAIAFPATNLNELHQRGTAMLACVERIAELTAGGDEVSEFEGAETIILPEEMHDNVLDTLQRELVDPLLGDATEQADRRSPFEDALRSLTRASVLQVQMEVLEERRIGSRRRDNHVVIDFVRGILRCAPAVRTIQISAAIVCFSKEDTNVPKLLEAMNKVEVVRLTPALNWAFMQWEDIAYNFCRGVPRFVEKLRAHMPALKTLWIPSHQFFDRNHKRYHNMWVIASGPRPVDTNDVLYRALGALESLEADGVDVSSFVTLIRQWSHDL